MTFGVSRELDDKCHHLHHRHLSTLFLFSTYLEEKGERQDSHKLKENNFKAIFDNEQVAVPRKLGAESLNFFAICVQLSEKPFFGDIWSFLFSTLKLERLKKKN